MEHEYITTTLRLMMALFIGGLIGFERSYHGRPAGFRTHALVCTSSSLLMLLSIFQWELIAGAPIETIRVDPTRMAQGIMTGIGFLGAGVIIKESLNVRGLTTAASLWMTASIGVVIGMGLYFAAILATVFSLMVLLFFRKIESLIPTIKYGQLSVSFSRNNYMTEEALGELIHAHDMRYLRTSYHMEEEGKFFRYDMTVHTSDEVNFRRLSDTLTGMETALEFSVVPVGG